MGVNVFSLEPHGLVTPIYQSLKSQRFIFLPLFRGFAYLAFCAQFIRGRKIWTNIANKKICFDARTKALFQEIDDSKFLTQF